MQPKIANAQCRISFALAENYLASLYGDIESQGIIQYHHLLVIYGPDKEPCLFLLRSDTYAREVRQKSEKLRRIAEVGLTISPVSVGRIHREGEIFWPSAHAFALPSPGSQFARSSRSRLSSSASASRLRSRSRRALGSKRPLGL